MKNMRRQFFRGRTFANSPRDIGIHAFEVEFIQLGKTARILLRRLDQGSFFVLVSLDPSRLVLAVFQLYKLLGEEKVTERWKWLGNSLESGCGRAGQAPFLTWSCIKLSRRSEEGFQG